MRNVKVTDFKTKRINRLTGGKIESFQIPDYPGEDGLLTNSFLSKDGHYIDNYDRGWWYVKHNLKVCNDHPCGVAELHEEGKHIGYHGFTHRGGSTYKIGDRLFDENYEPKEEDYTNEEWTKFMISRVNSIKREVRKGYAKTEEEAFNNIPISDVIPFVKRGSKLIETMEEAKKAAINMSNYLS
ncbi:MAG: hypothetical protein V3W20_07510 [Candidatus Neomarinimicrobiota bacterium]